MQRVLIIGGTGFIGDYLADNLSRNKDIQISIIYRKTSPNKKISTIHYISLDGEKDPKELTKELKKADYLIILSRPNNELIKNITQSNLKFKKIIFASTILIYPSSKIKQDEGSDLEAANKYEESKINEEKELSLFAKVTHNKLAIARLTNVYGDKKNRALIHWIISAIVNDEKFTLNNEGESIRDFIFVQDVAKYLELLLFLPQKKVIEIFNICTGKGFSINQVINELELITFKKLKIEKGVLTNEKQIVIGDNAKIVTETGYKPRYNLKSGLKKAYQNYLK